MTILNNIPQVLLTLYNKMAQVLITRLVQVVNLSWLYPWMDHGKHSWPHHLKCGYATTYDGICICIHT